MRQTWLGISAVGQDISREVSTMALKIKSASRSSASTAFLKLHSWQPAWDHSSLLPFYQLRHTTCSTNPLLIPIIWSVPRETQPKRKLVRESEVQMWKIHPFSSFYYHTIIFSSTLNQESRQGQRMACSSCSYPIWLWLLSRLQTSVPQRPDRITTIRELVLSQS